MDGDQAVTDQLVGDSWDVRAYRKYVEFCSWVRSTPMSFTDWSLYSTGISSEDLSDGHAKFHHSSRGSCGSGAGTPSVRQQLGAAMGSAGAGSFLHSHFTTLTQDELKGYYTVNRTGPRK